MRLPWEKDDVRPIDVTVEDILEAPRSEVLHASPESMTGVYPQLKELSKSHENIVLEEDRGPNRIDYIVSVRTSVRDVAVAVVDSKGGVQIYVRMLQRAVSDGLLTKARLDEALKRLGPPHREEIDKGPALLEIGDLSDRIAWLGSLAFEFAN